MKVVMGSRSKFSFDQMTATAPDIMDTALYHKRLNSLMFKYAGACCVSTDLFSFGYMKCRVAQSV